MTPTVEEIAPVSAQTYVDWPAIFGGAVVASSISLLLLAFGSAIGLSLSHPFENTGMSALGVGIALALWLVWTQVSSFMAGAYITGRLRRRAHDATEHESDVRDGFHGLIVWGVGVLIGAIVVTSGVTGIAGAGASAVGGATKTATQALSDSSTTGNPLGYIVDTAFRSTNQNSGANPRDARHEAIAIIARGLANGDVSQADRAYLAQIIAQRTGVSPADAKARVDTMISEAKNAASKAKQVAERAKKFAVLAAFITAASLAVSAAAAFWAAGVGGRHRDEETVVPFWFNRLR